MWNDRGPEEEPLPPIGLQFPIVLLVLRPALAEKSGVAEAIPVVSAVTTAVIAISQALPGTTRHFINSSYGAERLKSLIRKNHKIGGPGLPLFGPPHADDLESFAAWAVTKFWC
jgi:hypothetical protein